MRTKQCEKCPWKLTTNPFEIPDGYDVEKHKSLKGTIAEPGSLDFGEVQRVMACHESPTEAPQYCIGWVANQLGEGNNMALRMQALDGRFSEVEWPDMKTQHSCLEDTLPDES